MPDIGMIELIIIGVVAFMVLGPDGLPDFFSQIARFLRQARGWMSDLKQQFDQEKTQLVKPVDDIRKEIHASVEEVKTDITSRIENP